MEGTIPEMVRSLGRVRERAAGYVSWFIVKGLEIVVLDCGHGNVLGLYVDNLGGIEPAGESGGE